MTDLVIIGGGPAGMSAAVEAYKNGIKVNNFPGKCTPKKKNPRKFFGFSVSFIINKSRGEF